MSEQPKEEKLEKKTGFLPMLKGALEHGKALATIIVLLITLGTSLYASLKPEGKKAESVYDTMKAPIEEAVNKTAEHERELVHMRRELTEVKVRLDFYEKLVVAKIPELITTLQPPSVALQPPAVTEPKATFQLPDRPWEQKRTD